MNGETKKTLLNLVGWWLPTKRCKICSGHEELAVFRPTGFDDLRGKRVGVWGYGVEGQASVRRLGDTPSSIVIVDDTPSDGVLATGSGGLEQLLTCDVVLKSPGIPRRRPDVLALEERGVVVTSALNLWLAGADRERVIAVTGTKGKSTTTSLITFFLNVMGQHATSAGNIGLPPYDVAFDDSGFVVLEVSSFQAVDIAYSPSVIWTGTVQRSSTIATNFRLPTRRGRQRYLSTTSPCYVRRRRFWAVTCTLSMI
jgi:UDP-N-acetylmuramoylalanine-D-glutamate ligase